MQSPKNFITERNIGEITVTLPSPPKKSDINNHDLPKKKQKFYPPDQDLVYEISKKINDGIELTSDDVLFVKEENRKRKEGYWFYNNGNIEYITGLHYFYLSAWKITVVQDVFDTKGNLQGKKKFAGLPNFTDSDRDYFYFWDECVRNPKCVGMIHATNRRDGKTYRAGVTIYDAVISQYDAVGAIQSKTSTDAKEVFKKIVKSWQMLPSYYKPVDTGDTNPAKSLRFDEPPKRSSKNTAKEYSKVLRSEIAHHPSAEEQLDGMYVTIGLMDEAGKYTNTNAAEMWRVNRECVADGTFISGKYLITSTVEDMEKKGGRYFKELWDDSNPNDLNELGLTRTGLWRYFKPAYKGLRGEDENGIPFIDEYGYSDEKRTREYLEKKRKSLTGAALSSERRKYPIIVQDCFVMDSAEEVFPSYKLEEQRLYNDTLKGIIRTGNFYWENDDRTKVYFNDDPNGKFKVTWLPEGTNANKIVKTQGGYAPVGENIGAGLDPYDHNLKKDGRRLSNAGFYVFKGFDMEYPVQSNIWVCQYLYREENPEDMYESILKACVYYGTKVLVENQKPGFLNYLHREGYKGYIERTRKTDYTQSNSRTWEDGISMAGSLVRNQMINKLTTHIVKYVGKIDEKIQKEEYGISDTKEPLYGGLYFEELIEDFVNFQSNDWTDYDAVVGAGLAYMCLNPVERKSKNKGNDGGPDIDDPFTWFKI